MVRYAAFLRGINISGKNKICMAGLKAAFEAAGFTEVSTFLNSGNVVFSSEQTGLRSSVEKLIKDSFALEIPVFIIEIVQLQELLAAAPEWWGSGDKESCDNLIFILSADTPQEICAMLGEPSKGLERMQVCRNAIFWTFDRKRYQKCSWWKKTAGSGIAEKLTIRTAQTVRKVCAGSNQG